MMPIVLALLNMALGIVITHDLWAWHIASVFGLPALTYAQAAGLSIFTAKMTFSAADLDVVMRVGEHRPSLYRQGTVTGALLMFWALGRVAKVVQ